MQPPYLGGLAPLCARHDRYSGQDTTFAPSKSADYRGISSFFHGGAPHLEQMLLEELGFL
jgi:hypothetical protein